MKSQKEKNYKIFFVVDENAYIAYIGKSSAQSLRPILRKCVYGEDPVAVQAFGSPPPSSLVLVEQPAVHCTSEVANEHIKAWCARFTEYRFRTFRKPLPVTAANIPDYNKADAILETLQAYSLEDALHGKGVLRYSALKYEKDTLAPAQKHTAIGSWVSMTIRVSKKVAKAFRAFCRDLGVTQGIGLAVLMSRDQEAALDISTKDLLGRLKVADREIAKLRSEIKSLHTKETEDAAHKLQRAERREQEATLRIALSKTYWSAIRPPSEYPYTQPMQRYKFSNLKYKFPGIWDNYVFPSESGVTIFTLHAMSYGKAPNVRFIFGEDADGNLIKFRHSPYHREELGFSIWYNRTSQPGDTWVVAYLKCEDGAADLIDALPLPSAPPEPTGIVSPASTLLQPRHDYTPSIETVSPTKVDDLIADAQQRVT